MECYQIPKAMLQRIDKTLQEIHKSRVEYLSRQQVLDLFGWESKTLSTYISTGKIKPEMYIEPFPGTKLFIKDKLLGL